MLKPLKSSYSQFSSTDDWFLHPICYTSVISYFHLSLFISVVNYYGSGFHYLSLRDCYNTLPTIFFSSILLFSNLQSILCTVSVYWLIFSYLKICLPFAYVIKYTHFSLMITFLCSLAFPHITRFLFYCCTCPGPASSSSTVFSLLNIFIL